jgi:hypothetical protein
MGLEVDGGGGVVFEILVARGLRYSYGKGRCENVRGKLL